MFWNYLWHKVLVAYVVEALSAVGRAPRRVQCLLALALLPSDRCPPLQHVASALRCVIKPICNGTSTARGTHNGSHQKAVMQNGLPAVLNLQPVP
eukprot:jgi/Botrbrau1/7096/Bobra.0165s0118.1